MFLQYAWTTLLWNYPEEEFLHYIFVPVTVTCTLTNLFEFLLIQTQIRLYLPGSDEFGTKRMLICVPNQSVHGKYNLISVWIDKITKRFLCVYLPVSLDFIRLCVQLSERLQLLGIQSKATLETPRNITAIWHRGVWGKGPHLGPHYAEACKVLGRPIINVGFLHECV